MLLIASFVVSRFQIQVSQRYFCCSNMKLVKDDYLVCISCSQVHDYLTADEYVDFYEIDMR